MLPSESPLAAGQPFAERYRVERPIAEGGMGILYRARHTTTQRPVALKVMHRRFVASAALRTRFLREAQITAAVSSEHLVAVLDAGVDDATGMPFLVMELLEGEDLAQIVERRGALRGSEAIELLEQAARGLDRLHAAGIVHRDLKPENLFITYRDDGSPWLKIIDFGIAKQADPSAHAKTTQIGGTPLYMSPEQVLGLGDVGPAADIYALGHIAFGLLVGRPFFTDEVEELGASLRFLQQIVAGLPERAGERAARHGQTLPNGFDSWFSRAVALDPAARFHSAREAIGLLRPLVGAEAPEQPGAVDPLAATAGGDATTPIGPPPMATAPTARSVTAASVGTMTPRPRRGPATLVAAVLVPLVLVAAGLLVLWAIDRPRDDASAPRHNATVPVLAGDSPATPREPSSPPDAATRAADSPRSSAEPSAGPTTTSTPSAPATAGARSAPAATSAVSSVPAKTSAAPSAPATAQPSAATSVTPVLNSR